jgi:hypothetical protein
MLGNYTDRKVKGKVLVHVMKAYRENRGIAPLILNLGARWRWVINITPWEGTPVPVEYHV